MKESTRNQIYDLAERIVELAKEEGAEMLIGIATLEEGILWEGARASKGLEYETACKMLTGITAFVADYYGNKPEL